MSHPHRGFIYWYLTPTSSILGVLYYPFTNRDILVNVIFCSTLFVIFGQFEEGKIRNNKYLLLKK